MLAFYRYREANICFCHGFSIPLTCIHHPSVCSSITVIVHVHISFPQLLTSSLIMHTATVLSVWTSSLSHAHTFVHSCLLHCFDSWSWNYRSSRASWVQAGGQSFAVRMPNTNYAFSGCWCISTVHSWQESRKEQVVNAELLGTFVFDERSAICWIL